MEQNLQSTMAVLQRTPAALDALLRELPQEWTSRNEGENTWSVLQVVAHLIDSERQNWIARAQFLLEHGESRAFQPFDRGGLEREVKGKTLPQLLDEFKRVRAEKIEELRAMKLGPEELRRAGKHPTFGVVTLSQLLATWVAHDMTHLHQISRVLAHQYREAVGPWINFLGVLKCSGHSD